VPASNHSALSRFLKRLLGHSALNEEEQRAILGLETVFHQARTNHDIVSPRQTVEHACLVSHGLAARYDQLAGGKRQITAFYFPGDMCDLHSVVRPTSAWGIVALTDTSVLRVPHASLRKLVCNYPAISLAFWRDGTLDASILTKWVANLGAREARARIAHILCETGVRMERAGLGTRTDFWFEVTQNNLADAAGLTAVHVNRTLQSLKAQGIFQARSRKIIVNDWQALAGIAGFDEHYLVIEADPVVARELSHSHRTPHGQSGVASLRP